MPYTGDELPPSREDEEKLAFIKKAQSEFEARAVSKGVSPKTFNVTRTGYGYANPLINADFLQFVGSLKPEAPQPPKVSESLLIEWRAKFKAHELSRFTPPEAFKLNSAGNYLDWNMAQREALWIEACSAATSKDDLPFVSPHIHAEFEESISKTEGYAPGIAAWMREGKTYRGEFFDTKWRTFLASKLPSPQINRWQDHILDMPKGPWDIGNGGSFDRTRINPISDEMLEELALWLRLGYTPWNGTSVPLSDQDRQFMYLLYYSVQGLISRVRTAERECDKLRKGFWLTPQLLDQIQNEVYKHDREDGWCGHDVDGESLKNIILRVAKSLGISQSD